MRTLTRLSIVSILTAAAFVCIAPREAEARHYRYGRPYAAYYGAYYRPARVNYYRPHPRQLYRAYGPRISPR